MSLKDMLEGRLEHELHEGNHTDKVILQNVIHDGEMERVFQYTDTDSPSPGDYYYIRVTQLDGAQAWSSPFWVGNQKRGKRGRSVGDIFSIFFWQNFTVDFTMDFKADNTRQISSETLTEHLAKSSRQNSRQIFWYKFRKKTDN